VKNSIRRFTPALFVVIVAAAVVAACGQITTSEEAQSAAGVRVVQPITSKLVQSEVCVDGDPACVPTGAHAKHERYDCKVCHKYGGTLSFDKTGKAYGLAQPPTFDATTKTCSNVACHSVPAGTFTITSLDGSGEPYLNLLTVYGNAGGTTPSWNAPPGSASCTGCHPNPPRNGTDGSNVWHSGQHGGQGPTGVRNQCQFCHPDATGSNGQGTAITNQALHGNGVYNVQATFTTACFGCH
jgi:hypothetical protein